MMTVPLTITTCEEITHLDVRHPTPVEVFLGEVAVMVDPMAVAEAAAIHMEMEVVSHLTTMKVAVVNEVTTDPWILITSIWQMEEETREMIDGSSGPYGNDSPRGHRDNWASHPRQQTP